MNKFISAFLFCLFAFSCLYCDKSSDDTFKQHYSFIPKNACDIKVHKTSVGDFIDYRYKSNESVFVLKNGQIKNVKNEIEQTLKNLFPELDSYNLLLTTIHHNDRGEMVATAYCLLEKKYLCSAIYWSPERCVILPSIDTYDGYTHPTSINNNGIMTAYSFKRLFRTFYLGEEKIEKQVLCQELVPVVFTDPYTIKELKLYIDKNDDLSYLGYSYGRPYYITIDDDNYIHFWFDAHQYQHAGTIHLSEFD